MLNDERPSRYNIVRNTCSHVDLSIASLNLARIGEWDAMDRYTLCSDHYLILCRFCRDLRREVEKKVPRYNFSQAKWDTFQENAQSIVGEVSGSEGSVDSWNSLMMHAAACCTIHVKQEPSMCVPWWNKECD